MRAGGAQGVALAIGQAEQLRAVEQELHGCLAEVQGARRADLDLRAQELTRDAPAEALRRSIAQRLEAGCEGERLRLEDLELLLEPQVEVVMTPEEDAKLRTQSARGDISDPKEFKARFGFAPIVDAQLAAASDWTSRTA